MQDIIKHTSEGHPERKSLLKAQEIMVELLIDLVLVMWLLLVCVVMLLPSVLYY